MSTECEVVGIVEGERAVWCRGEQSEVHHLGEELQV